MLEPHVRGAPLTLNCGSINGLLRDREGGECEKAEGKSKKKMEG